MALLVIHLSGTNTNFEDIVKLIHDFVFFWIRIAALAVSFTRNSQAPCSSETTIRYIEYVCIWLMPVL